MNEIEIKVKVDNENNLMKKLEECKCKLSESKKQVDTIFLENNAKDFNIVTGMIVMRIRQVDDKNIITLKQRKEKVMESKEIEFFVSDYGACKDLIQTLGYKEMVTVEKERITTKYKDFNICIDKVKHLGLFAEIEIVTPDINMANYYEKEMQKVCGELGLNIDNRINSHYDTMVYEQKLTSK